MIFQAGIENHNEGRSIAWALEHPGCFAHGISENAALASLEGALERYADLENYSSWVPSSFRFLEGGAGLGYHSAKR